MNCDENVVSLADLHSFDDTTLSVADPGCLSRFRILPSRIQGPKDSGSASKNLGSSNYNTKNCFEALGKIIWDVHRGSMIRIRIFSPSLIPDPDPGFKSKKAPVHGSGFTTLLPILSHFAQFFIDGFELVV